MQNKEANAGDHSCNANAMQKNKCNLMQCNAYAYGHLVRIMMLFLKFCLVFALHAMDDPDVILL